MSKHTPTPPPTLEELIMEQETQEEKIAKEIKQEYTEKTKTAMDAAKQAVALKYLLSASRAINIMSQLIGTMVDDVQERNLEHAKINLGNFDDATTEMEEAISDFWEALEYETPNLATLILPSGKIESAKFEAITKRKSWVEAAQCDSNVRNWTL